MNVRRWLFAALVAFAAPLASGCDDPVTQVVVTVDAESTFTSTDTDLRVVVRGAAGGTNDFGTPARDVTLPVGAARTYRFPVDVTVAPRDGDASRRWQVEATATSGAEVATVRVRGAYVDGRTLRVTLLLEDDCVGVVCGADQSCVAGTCAPIEDVGGTPPDPEGVPKHCAEPIVRVPDPEDHTLDEAGIAPVYPAFVACPGTVDPGDDCPGTSAPDDFCFSDRVHDDLHCRIPCTPTLVGSGPVMDDAKCQAFHPDSHCMHAQGSESPDSDLCSIPCNPVDDVGCPTGQHCLLVNDSARALLITDCVPLADDPGHQSEPCSIVDGMAYPDLYGCDAGYTCTYDNVCRDPVVQGSVCSQLCDLDRQSPRITCPDGYDCVRYADHASTFGPLELGRCIAE